MYLIFEYEFYGRKCPPIHPSIHPSLHPIPSIHSSRVPSTHQSITIDQFPLRPYASPNSPLADWLCSRLRQYPGQLLLLVELRREGGTIGRGGGQQRGIVLLPQLAIPHSVQGSGHSSAAHIGIGSPKRRLPCPEHFRTHFKDEEREEKCFAILAKIVCNWQIVFWWNFKRSWGLQKFPYKKLQIIWIKKNLLSRHINPLPQPSPPSLPPHPCSGIATKLTAV